MLKRRNYSHKKKKNFQWTLYSFLSHVCATLKPQSTENKLASKYGTDGEETKQLSEAVTLELESTHVSNRNCVWGIPCFLWELKRGTAFIIST